MPLVSYGGSSLLSTLIMFAIIQGLYILREDEEEIIERKKKEQQIRQLRAERSRKQRTQEARREQLSRQRAPERPKRRQAPRKKKRARNKEFARVTYVFVALFLVMMGYIGYFTVVKSKDIISSPYNPRLDSMPDVWYWREDPGQKW